MSAIEVNKVVGSVLLVLLAIWVIGIVGDALVQPREQPAVAVASVGAPAAPAEEKKEEVLPKVGPLLASASAENGAKIFRKCHACHNAEKGAGAKVGPDLWNIVNADRASREGFSYSSAMKEKEGNWTYEALNEFLHKPRDYVPGTKMAFAGLKKVEDRADVIAYLRTLSDSPAPLPQSGDSGAAEPGQGAAEPEAAAPPAR